MTGFEPETSGIRSNRAVSWPSYKLFLEPFPHHFRLFNTDYVQLIVNKIC